MTQEAYINVLKSHIKTGKTKIYLDELSMLLLLYSRKLCIDKTEKQQFDEKINEKYPQILSKYLKGKATRNRDLLTEYLNDTLALCDENIAKIIKLGEDQEQGLFQVHNCVVNAFKKLLETKKQKNVMLKLGNEKTDQALDQEYSKQYSEIREKASVYYNLYYNDEFYDSKKFAEGHPKDAVRSKIHPELEKSSKELIQIQKAFFDALIEERVATDVKYNENADSFGTKK